MSRAYEFAGRQLSNRTENPDGSTMQWELITPKIAQELVDRTAETNENFRKLSSATVAKYARAMLDGRWEHSSANTIHISPEGGILNGQHTMRAVVQSGVSGKFLVVRNATSNVFDIGRGRTSGQLIDSKYGLPSRVASAINSYALWKTGKGRTMGNLPMSYDQTAAFLDSYESLDIFQEASDWQTALTKANLGLGYVGGFTYLVLRDCASKEHVDEFFEALRVGANLSLNSPILALRTRLMAKHFSSIRAGNVIAEWQKKDLVFRTWNQYITNTETGQRLNHRTPHNKSGSVTTLKAMETPKRCKCGLCK